MLYKIISSSLILYDCFCLVVRLFVLLFDYLINVLNNKKKYYVYFEEEKRTEVQIRGYLK